MQYILVTEVYESFAFDEGLFSDSLTDFFDVFEGFRVVRQLAEADSSFILFDDVFLADCSVSLGSFGFLFDDTISDVRGGFVLVRSPCHFVEVLLSDVFLDVRSSDLLFSDSILRLISDEARSVLSVFGDNVVSFMSLLAEAKSDFSEVGEVIATSRGLVDAIQTRYVLGDLLRLEISVRQVSFVDWLLSFIRDTRMIGERLEDSFYLISSDVDFDVRKFGLLVDYVLFNSVLSHRYIGAGSIWEVLLFGDEVYSRGDYRQSVYERVLFKSYPSVVVPSDFSDVLHLFDFLRWFNLGKVEGVLGFWDGVSCLASSLVRDEVVLGDEGRSELLLWLFDRFFVREWLSEFRRVVSDVLSRVVFVDLVDFVRDVLFDAIYLYVNFYMPERWSIVVERAGYRSDTIFCLGDGLYELDFSKASEDTALVLNLAQLSTPKVKRIDKIYYDSKPSEVRIYTEEDVYNLEGEENYVSVPKGIRGKEMKVGLYGMKEVEYVDIGLILEKRSKL